MNKKILLLIMCMLLFSFSFTSSIDSQGYGKRGETFTFIQTCSDASFMTLLTVQYPNRSVETINANMTALGSGAFGYNFTDTIVGRHDVTGVSDGCTKTFATYFEITGTGFGLDTPKSIVYIGLFVVFIFFFVLTLFGISKLPDSNSQDIEGRILQISYLKYLRPVLYVFLYFLIIGMVFMASNLGFAYLGETLFANVFFTLYKILFGLSPVVFIVWIISFFVMFFHDKKFQEMLNRGIFPQGRI